MVTSHKFDVGDTVQLINGTGPKMKVISSEVNFFTKLGISVICEYFDDSSKTTKLEKFNQHELMRVEK